MWLVCQDQECPASTCAACWTWKLIAGKSSQCKLDNYRYLGVVKCITLQSWRNIHFRHFKMT
jgi:hypothetical protein